MNTEPFVSRITIYPVKSLDGLNLQKAEISEGGCLLHDREFAMIDEFGKFINGKSNKLVHSLRSAVDFDSETISFRQINDIGWTSFHLQNERSELQHYLSDYFGIKTMLLHNKTGRFLDIPDDSGATVVSTSSLKEVSSWFNIIDPDETRKRFRATIEIEGVPAFWEDNLFSPEIKIEFMVGDVTLYGMSPRARCVVPTRNPETGEVIHAFQRSFAKHRASALPKWSSLNEFEHFYYLSVDCFIPASEIGKEIRTGDKIEITGVKVLQE